MKRYGTDGRFDEDIIIDALSQPTDDEDAHRNGVFMALVAAWDRDITRDQFMAMASAVLTTSDRIGRLSMMHAIRAFLQQGNFRITPADVETAIASAGKMLDASTDDVRKMAHLIKEMPTSQDAIN